ncbi:MAG: M15 family metallopeptidase [Patescibacteria group bacterium]
MNSKKLENLMVSYRDLLKVKTVENHEELFQVRDIPGGYIPIMSDMRKISGNSIWVRKSVEKRLSKAQALVRKNNPGLSLYITYGFRSIEIQTRRFLERLFTHSDTFFSDPYELYEKIHRSVAVPTVAGHPTGGAVDVMLVEARNNKPIDFGSAIYDYQNLKYYVFSDEITNEQMKYRKLLRKIMMEAGFAPYDGEWWHFSYGDREWAFYYKKPCAVYEQLVYPFSTSQNRGPALSQASRCSSGS